MCVIDSGWATRRCCYWGRCCVGCAGDLADETSALLRSWLGMRHRIRVQGVAAGSRTSTSGEDTCLQPLERSSQAGEMLAFGGLVARAGAQLTRIPYGGNFTAGDAGLMLRVSGKPRLVFKARRRVQARS